MTGFTADRTDRFHALRDGFAMVETLCAIAAAEVYEIEVTGQEIKEAESALSI